MKKQDAKYDRWVETKDGRMIGYILHGLDYRDKVEITNNEIYVINQYESEYKTSNFPTLMELKQRGEVVEKLSYKEHTVNMVVSNKLSDTTIRAIISSFKLHGFNVTKEAILNNFEAYKCGLGCGYRDDTNGYHLFTPHDKEFYLCATTLNKLSSDWQTTCNF